MDHIADQRLYTEDEYLEVGYKLLQARNEIDRLQAESRQWQEYGMARNEQLVECRAQVDRLQAELADWQETARHVMAEECAPDEQHCTCVPILRKQLELAYEANCSLAEDRAIIGRWAAAWKRAAKFYRVYHHTPKLYKFARWNVRGEPESRLDDRQDQLGNPKSE